MLLKPVARFGDGDIFHTEERVRVERGHPSLTTRWLRKRGQDNIGLGLTRKRGEQAKDATVQDEPFHSNESWRH
jgi:hypothetical protein